MELHSVPEIKPELISAQALSLAELVEAVRARTGWGPKRYSVRQAAYDLAKLRGKKLVKRKDQSRRYVSDPSGVRTMCAYVLLREKVIKPLLAGVTRPIGRPPKALSPLDRHYVNLREELNRTFDTIGLAA
jgi:hypothetical protein